ncbi:hypothetical protein GE09DRAFT_1242700 [Coniochaeta sp. 2T2.1]|nr:hypothetical protein GE09DRAFT_1242700 [Coniochaeta sp. 2T2.1]
MGCFLSKRDRVPGSTWKIVREKFALDDNDPILEENVTEVHLVEGRTKGKPFYNHSSVHHVIQGRQLIGEGQAAIPKRFIRFDMTGLGEMTKKLLDPRSSNKAQGSHDNPLNGVSAWLMNAKDQPAVTGYKVVTNMAAKRFLEMIKEHNRGTSVISKDGTGVVPRSRSRPGLSLSLHLGFDLSFSLNLNLNLHLNVCLSPNIGLNIRSSLLNLNIRPNFSINLRTSLHINPILPNLNRRVSFNVGLSVNSNVLDLDLRLTFNICLNNNPRPRELNLTFSFNHNFSLLNLTFSLLDLTINLSRSLTPTTSIGTSIRLVRGKEMNLYFPNHWSIHLILKASDEVRLDMTYLHQIGLTPRREIMGAVTKKFLIRPTVTKDMLYTHPLEGHNVWLSKDDEVVTTFKHMPAAEGYHAEKHQAWKFIAAMNRRHLCSHSIEQYGKNLCTTWCAKLIRMWIDEKLIQHDAGKIDKLDSVTGSHDLCGLEYPTGGPACA